MSRPQAGFSLVEMMAATVAVAIMSLGIFSVMQSSATAMRTNAAQLDAYQKAARVFQKIERHVRGASLANLATLPAGFETAQPLAEGIEVDNLILCTMVSTPGAEEELPALSAPLAVYLEPSATDPVNGLDDDRDGVVDGRNLVLDRPGHAPERIASGIAAFGASLSGQSLTLSVDVAVRQPDGSARVETKAHTLEIRNG
ncbi:MAG: prepilin-type N-terminal cleavage/methylation domain-containing protein [Planctomycetes bacterium]|nr:prepilin-type N-terminal cleavage/methylation domain-containing protein [Planctomycetota bacterium]